MKIHASLMVLFASFVFTASLSAESLQVQTSHLVLAYMQKSASVEVFDVQNKPQKVSLGMKILEGWTIQTTSDSAEFKLEPNGSTIRLAPATRFVFESGRLGEEQRFELVQGKLRMLAAKVGGGGGYAIRTASSVAGVRGTDFARAYNPAQKKDWLCVLEGAISLERTGEKDPLLVSGGKFVNLLQSFTALTADAEWVAANFADIQFNK